MLTLGGGAGASPLNVQVEQDADGGLVAYGRAPAGTAHLVFTDAGGTRTTAAPTADGWFVVMLPGSDDPTSLMSIEAVSASGRHADPRPARRRRAGARRIGLQAWPDDHRRLSRSQSEPRGRAGAAGPRGHGHRGLARILAA